MHNAGMTECGRAIAERDDREERSEQGAHARSELWQHDLLHEFAAVLFSPRVDHFHVESPAILANQGQRDQLRLGGELAEFTI